MQEWEGEESEEEERERQTQKDTRKAALAGLCRGGFSPLL